MMIEMQSFEVGPLGVNCYVLWEKNTKEGLVIDPGGDVADILQYITAKDIHVVAIVNTHGHGDHIGANDSLREATGAKLFIHQADAYMLADLKENFSAYMGVPAISKPADGFLADGDIVAFGDSRFSVMHTPGHSPGGICLLGGGMLFSGDSLFSGSIGRCDFPGASAEQLISALKEKVLPLPDETMVYPGHGPSTSIGQERRHNPYLSM
jgi:hydroxyacylglutathione hydrolase